MRKCLCDLHHTPASFPSMWIEKGERRPLLLRVGARAACTRCDRVSIPFRYRFDTASIPLQSFFNTARSRRVRVRVRITIQLESRSNPDRSRCDTTYISLRSSSNSAGILLGAGVVTTRKEVLRFVENFGVFVNTFCNQISRNQLGIETRVTMEHL